MKMDVEEVLDVGEEVNVVEEVDLDLRWSVSFVRGVRGHRKRVFT